MSASCNSDVPSFTPEQHSQLLHLINKGKWKDTNAIVNVTKVGSTGTSNTSSSINDLMTYLVDQQCILDNGASNHMVHNLNLLNRIEQNRETDRWTYRYCPIAYRRSGGDYS